jgi:hypothetical protein
MKKVSPDPYFFDRIEGREVYLFKDCFGVLWMAYSKCGLRTESLRNESRSMHEYYRRR